MKHTIRITIAVLVISFAAACCTRHDATVCGGKSYVPAGK